MSQRFPQFSPVAQENGKKTEKPPKLSQQIFTNVYEQLRPVPGTDIKKAADRFIDPLAQAQIRRFDRIDGKASIEQFIEKIWTEGIAIKLARFQNNPSEFENRKIVYGNMYLKLKEHILRLIKSGEVESFVAKVFLSNFRAFKSSYFYNDIVKNQEIPNDEARKKYSLAFQSLYEMYRNKGILEQDIFFHFNIRAPKDLKVKNRIYLSANLAGLTGKFVEAWKNALLETGLQDKIYFKMPAHLGRRYDTIIVYQTEDITDEEFGEVIAAFKRLCPEYSLSAKSMPSSAPITRGISYAPEPKNLNELFRAMDVKSSDYDDSPIRISYNELISIFVQFSFELSYRDFVMNKTGKPQPRDLKERAGKYFDQLVKLAGINPDTMVPNAQGGTLPVWAEKISTEKV